MWAQLFFVLSQITFHRKIDRHDGRTDRFLVARPRCMQCMQSGKNYLHLEAIVSTYM